MCLSHAKVTIPIHNSKPQAMTCVKSFRINFFLVNFAGVHRRYGALALPVSLPQ